MLTLLRASPVSHSHVSDSSEACSLRRVGLVRPRLHLQSPPGRRQCWASSQRPSSPERRSAQCEVCRNPAAAWVRQDTQAQPHPGPLLPGPGFFASRRHFTRMAPLADCRLLLAAGPTAWSSSLIPLCRLPCLRRHADTYLGRKAAPSASRCLRGEEDDESKARSGAKQLGLLQIT